MKIKIFLFLFQPLILLSQTTYISNSINQFGIDACLQLKDSTDFLISPASISTAMGMTYLGAAGLTKNEIKEVFHYPSDTDFANDFPRFVDLLNMEYPSTTISLANKLWAGKGRIKLNESFLEKNREYFHSTLDTLDFIDKEKSSNTINEWVAEQTENKITQLIDPGFITDDLILVLTNAIYFKSNWAKKFDAKQTQKGNFYNENKETVEVDYMTGSGHYSTYEDQDVNILELPYADDSFSFLILLPKKSMIHLQNQMDHSNYIFWTRALATQEINLLQVPKFKSSSHLKMRRMLTDMGMPTAFGGANFTAMGNSPLGRIRMSAVIHETFMEFNEEGTEASAATAIGMAARSMAPPPKVFRADRPFIYILRHKPSNTILFIGKMSNPKY